jgi:tRNA pseudouridine38-40 synthase
LAQLDIQKQGDTIIFNLSANAFLHHMVRNIVGCLVYIGKGKHPPQWMREVLEGKERSLAAPTFAPDGLYLYRVTFDAKWKLPQIE